MKKYFCCLIMLYSSCIFAENFKNNNEVGVNVPYERHNYIKACKNFSMKTRRFSDKLSDKNLKIFCEEFNDSQREQAMELVEKNENLTHDQAVERIARKK